MWEEVSALMHYSVNYVENFISFIFSAFPVQPVSCVTLDRRMKFVNVSLDISVLVARNDKDLFP